MVTIRGHFSLSENRFNRPPSMTSGVVRVGRAAGGRWAEPQQDDVTEILPLDGFAFGDLDLVADVGDLDLSDDSAFDNEAQVLLAPELDDLHDVDDLAPRSLAAPMAVPLMASFLRDADTDTDARHLARSPS